MKIVYFLIYIVIVLIITVESVERNGIRLSEGLQSDITIPKKVCDIISRKMYASHVNYIYSDDEVPVSYNLELNLYKCMCQFPILKIAFEKKPIEYNRESSSTSVILIPEIKTEALTRVKQINHLLISNQTNKHIHKYIFIWRGALLSNLREFFQMIWSKQILNAIVVTDQNKIFTFEPFSAEGFRVVAIANEIYFYDKLRNLYHHKLKISMFKDEVRALPTFNFTYKGYEAVDGLVASTIITALNATAEYMLPMDNQNYGACENGSFTGSQGDIIAGFADVAFNGRFVLACAENHLEQLYPYRNRFIYLVVPAAEQRDEYLIFVNAFTNNLWRFLLLIFALSCLIFYLLQWCTRKIPKLHHSKQFKWYEIIEFVWQTQLGEPVESFSKISSLRQFLITWILFSYVITSVYFAKLESSFVRPTFEDEIDSLNDLHKLDTLIYGPKNFFEAVELTLLPKHWEKIKAKMVPIPGSYTGHKFFLPMIRNSTKMSFILRGSTARVLLANSYTSEYNRPAFHVVKQYLRALPLTYITTRGSIYKHKLNFYINIFYEYGLLKHWMLTDVLNQHNAHKGGENFNTLSGSFETTASARNHKKELTKRVVLSLEILQGAFYLWTFGIILSCLGFIAEHLYQHFKEPKNKNSD